MAKATKAGLVDSPDPFLRTAREGCFECAGRGYLWRNPRTPLEHKAEKYPCPWCERTAALLRQQDVDSRREERTRTLEEVGRVIDEVDDLGITLADVFAEALIEPLEALKASSGEK